MVATWVCLLIVFCAGALVDAGSSYASSYSYSGYPPVTHTSTSGSGTAYASAGPYNPYHAYYNSYYNRQPGFPFFPFIFPPYRFRRSTAKADSFQQIQQTKIPPGLVAYANEHPLPTTEGPSPQMPVVASPPLSAKVETVESQYEPNVPPFSVPAGIIQELSYPENKHNTDNPEQKLLLL